MSPIAQLRILETVARGRIESYLAVDPATNQLVLLHYGDAGLFDVADELSDDVFDWGEKNERHYIVTPDRPDYRDLNPRLKPWPDPEAALRKVGRWRAGTNVQRESQSGQGKGEPRNVMSEKDPPKQKDPDEAGEFTRMFQTPKTAPSHVEEPLGGEFTRMFQPVRSSAALPEKTPEPMPSAPEDLPVQAEVRSEGRALLEETVVIAPPKKSVPEEPRPDFTRVFQRTPQPQRPSKPEPTPAKPEANEFTSLFKAPPSTPPPAAPPNVPGPVLEPRSEPAPASKPGEFTSLFAAPAGNPTSRPVADAQPPVQIPESEPQPKQASPGAFTEFFRKPAPEASASRPAPAPQAGGLTDLFARPAPPVATPQSSPVGQKPHASEFTRFFENPLPATEKQVDWKAVQNQPAPPPTAKSAGEFTRMFGKPGFSDPVKESARSPVGREGATDIFQTHKAGPADAPAEVDDFARLFAKGSAADQAPPTAPAAAAPAPAASGNESAIPLPKKLPGAPPMVLLIVIILAIVIIAGCAFYYFVLKK